MSKIQELKNQCYYEVQEGRNAFETYTVTRFDTDKFAELIAQECAKICKTVGGDKVSNASKDYQEGREMGAEVCYNQIKEHFGVE
jgi:hypothetical protein